MPPDHSIPDAAAQEVRSRPHSLEAEISVLGAVFCQNEVLADVREIIESAEDFYLLAHRKIYGAMCALGDDGQVIDYVTLGEALLRRGELEEVGGTATFMRLAEAVPTSANAKYYAAIVADRALTRRLLDTAQQIAAECFLGAEKGVDLVEAAEQKVFAVSARRDRGGLVQAKEIVNSAFESIERAKKSDGISGVPTGYIDLDRKTSGLKPGDLFILAARPSMGKTAMALNIARNVSLEGKIGVAFFSVEMDKEQIVQRLLSSEAGIGLQQIREGFVGQDHWRSLTHAASSIIEAPLFIDDTPGVSVSRMRGRLVRLKTRRLREIRQRNERLLQEAESRGEEPPSFAQRDEEMEALGLVVVDYLQLMQPPNLRRNSSRENEISAISRGLKELSREIGAPFMVLSQLSRRVEERRETGKRPQLSDLRESGAIQQDADLVAFIYRESYYLTEGDEEQRQKKMDLRHDAELILAKQRNGPTGTIKLYFDDRTVSFRSMTQGGG